MKSGILSMMIMMIVAFGAVARAEIIAGWNFEDQNLTVDVTTPENTDNAITSSSTAAATYSSGVGGSLYAASWTDMASLNVSYVEVPVDTTGYTNIAFIYSARTSNTASKYWKVQYSSTGSAGPFTDAGSVIEQVGTAWTQDNLFDLSAVTALNNNANVVFRVVATDSLGTGSGAWIQADGSGDPASTGTFRIDEVKIQNDATVPPTNTPSGPTNTPSAPTNTPGPPTATPTGPTPTPPPVTAIKINEVYINPPGTDIGCYVELYFPGGSTLSGYSLVGVNGFDGTDYSSIDLSAYSIPADGYFVIAQDSNVPDADLIDANVNFQNGPDSIQLRQGAIVIDAIGYGEFTGGTFFAGEGSPAPAYFTGEASHSRLPDGFDTNDNLVDFQSGQLTAGSANLPGGGGDTPTPGPTETQPTPTPTGPTPTPPPIYNLKINEIHVNPDGADVGCFVEIYMPTGSTVSLDGYYLVGVNGFDGTDYVSIPLTGMIGPGQYFVVAQDNSVPNGSMIDELVNFQNGPDSIQLRAGMATVVDAIGYGTFLPTEFFAGEGTAAPYANPTGNLSLSRLPNGTDTGNNSVDFQNGELTAGVANVAAGGATPTPGPSTPTFTPTRTGTPTNTPVPPTSTPTTPPGSPTYTAIPTNTPTNTPTRTPTMPSTFTPTPTATITNPTHTPTAQPTNTPNACTTLGVTLEMPSAMYEPGDPCWLKAYVCNPNAETYNQVPVFVILEAFGQYFFAPTFTSYDHYTLNVTPGMHVLDPLPMFPWPTGAGSADGLIWYGAMTDQAVTTLFGELDTFTFGWTE